MDTVEVKSEGLEEEIRSKKDNEYNRKVKAEDLQEKTTSSRQSMSNSKTGTSVRQAKSDAVSKWIPSNKGSYTDSMRLLPSPQYLPRPSSSPFLRLSPSSPSSTTPLPNPISDFNSVKSFASFNSGTEDDDDDGKVKREYSAKMKLLQR
ncbi:hypothetical protein L2E82_30797 [Cichorium intybus]|uniref:Uncharacterized protein n=1 Tax=Cichorium intybus TaxID=13427 RepID=A0ACB9D1D1_CICIN|nr:hypothetical protein L2E82_30797 [Cichorium intybus]